MYAYITFPVYSFQNFIYKVPYNLKSKICPGTCVCVIFRNKRTLGYVVNLSKYTSFKGKILSIDNIDNNNLDISNELWSTLEWTRDYYLAPFGQVIKASIPLNFNTKYKSLIKEYISITKIGIEKLKFWEKNAPIQKKILQLLYNDKEKYIPLSLLSKVGNNYRSSCRKLLDDDKIKIIVKNINPFRNYKSKQRRNIKLNTEQDNAYQLVKKSITNNIFSPFYLQGVTGSGKTEVYLKLAIETVKEKKSVIILVPEISLTPSVFQKFHDIFENKVALWHSKLTKPEKGWVWQELKKGNISVIIGARSAIFLPMKNLGLIVVDEEQESSYKQENPSPRYNARDVSLVRAKFSNSVALLASATPSLESYYNCLNKKFQLVELKKRFGGSVYPNIKLINMKLNYNINKQLSEDLVNEINKCILNNEQIILLHNRRGYANIQICTNCEWILHCPDCSISLTYHKTGNMMLCHHCNYKTNLSTKCPECQLLKLEIRGYGTQRIEDEIENTIPLAKIIRMDLDSSKNKGAHYKILQSFENQDFNILLGTQMIAKGLDFDKVTLVGIINADVGLFLPDFRAGEKIFQLIYQVAGRSGRRKKQGKVFIQTYNPDDIFIKTASNLDLNKFYNISLAQRNELSYPPFKRICRILFQGKNKSETQSLSNKIGEKIEKNNFEVLGPSIAPIEKIKGMWRYHLLIKIDQKKPYAFQQFFKNKIGLEFLQKPQNKIKISLDIDPVSML